MELYRGRSDNAPSRPMPARMISATSTIIAGGETHKVPAFAPEVPAVRAICIVSADPRGRDALLGPPTRPPSHPVAPLPPPSHGEGVKGVTSTRLRV